MRLSIVIPFYFGLPEKATLLSRCISSLHGHDELIIIGHKSESLPWALNRGMEATHGEFILIMSDDMYVEMGQLLDLCHESYITHPLVNQQAQLFGGAMCFPRHIYEAVGEYDETFQQGYYDDDDMIKRIEIAGFERRIVPSVSFCHPDPGKTLSLTTNSDIRLHNLQYYIRKWGEWNPAPTPPNL